MNTVISIAPSIPKIHFFLKNIELDHNGRAQVCDQAQKINLLHKQNHKKVSEFLFA